MILLILQILKIWLIMVNFNTARTIKQMTDYIIRFFRTDWIEIINRIFESRWSSYDSKAVFVLVILEWQLLLWNNKFNDYSIIILNNISVNKYTKLNVQFFILYDSRNENIKKQTVNLRMRINFAAFHISFSKLWSYFLKKTYSFHS